MPLVSRRLNPPLRDWKGRSAWLLGASSGIGRATAEALHGQGAGNAFRWSYVLALPVNGRVWNVSMDDWMYLMDGRTLLNRTAMSKLGLHLGDVTLAIIKE